MSVMIRRMSPQASDSREEKIWTLCPSQKSRVIPKERDELARKRKDRRTTVGQQVDFVNEVQRNRHGCPAGIYAEEIQLIKKVVGEADT